MSDQSAWIMGMQRRMGVVQRVLDERIKQDNKWGPLPREHNDHKWNTILSEEVGEVARAILEHQPEHMIVELVQVAAVAVAWIEEALIVAEAAG